MNQKQANEVITLIEKAQFHKAFAKLDSFSEDNFAVNSLREEFKTGRYGADFYQRFTLVVMSLVINKMDSIEETVTNQIKEQEKSTEKRDYSERLPQFSAYIIVTVALISALLYIWYFYKAKQETELSANSNNIKADEFFIKAGQEQDIKKKIVLYDSCIMLNPQHIRAYLERGRSKGDSSIKLYKEAVEDFDKAIGYTDKDSLKARAHNGRGWVKIRLKLYKEAIKDFNESISLNHPELEKPFTNRADAYFNLNFFEKAENDYTTALKIKNKIVYAYAYRGLARYNLKKYREAIQDFDRVIEIEPKDAFAYHHRGNAKSEQNRYEDALVDYNKALSITATNPYIYYDRGLSKYDSKKYREAIEDFDKAISIYPEYKQAYLQRAEVKKHLYLYQEASLDVQSVLDIEPKSIDGLCMLANIKNEQGYYQDAINDYNKIIDIDATYGFVYYNRGLAYKCLKKYQEAIKDFNSAINLEPDNDESYSSLALVYSELRNREETLKALQKAIKLAPDIKKKVKSVEFAWLQGDSDFERIVR